jgi:uncharacterized damage-inducible protein DinB
MAATTGNSASVGEAFVAQARRRLAASSDRIKHCVEQLNDAQVWWRPQESMNSIANILLHLCGNLRQWIVSGVGGAADVRDRPKEFSQRQPISKQELLRRLHEVIGAADQALAGLTDANLLAPRRIQGFDETVLSAIFDTLAHLSGHTQEIVFITRSPGSRPPAKKAPRLSGRGQKSEARGQIRSVTSPAIPARTRNPEF